MTVEHHDARSAVDHVLYLITVAGPTPEPISPSVAQAARPRIAHGRHARQPHSALDGGVEEVSVRIAPPAARPIIVDEEREIEVGTRMNRADQLDILSRQPATPASSRRVLACPAGRCANTDGRGPDGPKERQKTLAQWSVAEEPSAIPQTKDFYLATPSVARHSPSPTREPKTTITRIAVASGTQGRLCIQLSVCVPRNPRAVLSSQCPDMPLSSVAHARGCTRR